MLFMKNKTNKPPATPLNVAHFQKYIYFRNHVPNGTN